MKKILASQLIGFGHHIPSRIIENAVLEKQFQLSPGWIAQRTGIRKRHWVEETDTLVALAEKASIHALENAGIAQKKIAMVILATSTPDHLLPPTAPLLAHKLGLTHAGAFDLAGACSGFLYALTMADSFVRTHQKAVLVVAANILSRRINHDDINTAILFADAAGAVILAPTENAEKGILGMYIMADGSNYNLISIPAGGSKVPFSAEIPSAAYKIKLDNGKIVFARACKMMTECARLAVDAADISVSDIHYFIPHQANLRMITTIAQKLAIPETKIISPLCEYGNSSAAGIPLALSLTQATKRFTEGEKILLTTAGAGMTGGALVVGM